MNTDQRIRHLRQSGLSKSAVAAVLNVDPADVSGVLSGRDVNVTVPLVPEVVTLRYPGPGEFVLDDEDPELAASLGVEAIYRKDVTDWVVLADGVYVVRAAYLEFQGEWSQEEAPGNAPYLGWRLNVAAPSTLGQDILAQGVGSNSPTDIWCPSFSLGEPAYLAVGNSVRLTAIIYATLTEPATLSLRNVTVAFERVIIL